jgi:hypothetical protein
MLDNGVSINNHGVIEMSDQNPIIEKIKKLLALAADQSASEGERDNALRMAHGLLAKHNLDMSEVKASQQCEGREEHINPTYGMLWCRNVSHHVAKLFFCKYFYGQKINGTKWNHHFVGKSSNVVTAALMSDFIIHSILKECRSRGWHNLSAEARSFAMGATRVIGERVAALMKSPEGASESTALVVRNLYQTEQEANEAFVEAKGTKLVSHKVRASTVHMPSYHAGKDYGSKVGLDVQVANRSALRIGG